MSDHSKIFERLCRETGHAHIAGKGGLEVDRVAMAAEDLSILEALRFFEGFWKGSTRILE